MTVTFTEETGVIFWWRILKNPSIEGEKEKATLGITEQSRARDFIELWGYYLDVDSSPPGDKEVSKGMTVRHKKWYVSWVQNAVTQFGSYPLKKEKDISLLIFIVRKDLKILVYGLIRDYTKKKNFLWKNSKRAKYY